MAATLTVDFTNPTEVGTVAPAIAAVVQQAFSAWTQQFDYTAGAYTIDVSFDAANQPVDASIVNPAIYADKTAVYPGGQLNVYAVVGQGSTFLGLVEPVFALDFSGANDLPVATPTLYLNSGYLTGSISLANALAPIERELGHELGITALMPDEFFLDAGLFFPLRSVYEQSTNPDGIGNKDNFDGPNAEAVYGGPVPVVPANPAITMASGFQAVDTTIQGAGSLQPLDVALLRDAGIPALTQQELAEHDVARLYNAAFGRDADSAGLIVQYAGLRAGLSLGQLADGFVGSQEFANLYGTNISNGQFVNELYQNVLGRPGDSAGVALYDNALAAGADRGTVLASFAESDEERGLLNANPNVAYAATAEEQVARLYDTAFGRAADPAGYDLYTQAIINGTTLQQAAMSFLSSPEFANRYGTNPSNQALVDGLYQNTLHRAPDAAGEALFVDALSSGQFSRADLVVSFSESQEHIDLMAQTAAARSSAGYNIDLTPQLGIIPVISAPTSS